MSGRLGRIWLVAVVAALVACSGQPENKPQTREQGPAGQAQDALPVGSHQLEGRTLTVRLPYRSRDNRLWVAGTDEADSAPFVFHGLDLLPGAGPDGTDLAIFHYEADGAGTATLRFGLVPAGRTLIGPEDTRVEDPAAFPAYSATVAVP